MLKATRIRIYPEDDQECFLIAQFGAVRWVWNKALWVKQHAWKTHGLDLSPVHDLKKLLAIAKKNPRRAWLRAVDSMALQQVLMQLEHAYRNFFEGRARFPRFKRRNGPQSSYHCTGAIGVGAGWITIPKLKGRIRAVVHRPIDGRIKSITLSRTASGKYFASILHETDALAPELPAAIAEQDVIAIDLGLIDVVTTNHGRRVPNPRPLKKALKNLRRKQKKLARAKKGSKNRGKARRSVARAHERVANVRADFQHKLSHDLVAESQGAIVAETLSVRNMLRNRKLARAISDVGWGGFLRMVEYKAARKGIHFVRIGRWEPTSKTCSCCGHRRETLALSVRAWTCEACGAAHDRDINAARNIARLGIERLTAGGILVAASGGMHKTADRPQLPLREEKTAA